MDSPAPSSAVRRALARATAGKALDLDEATVLLGVTGADLDALLAVDARHSSTTPDLVGTTGTALLALGLCLLVSRRAGLLLVPLSAVGSMPLTVYTAHLLVLHHTDSDDPTRYYLLQVGTALVVAPVWRHVVGRGTLEAALALVGKAVRGPT